MADLSIANYLNHNFQAVSILLSENEVLPNAVITVSGDSYTINPLVLFNDKTRIGYYQCFNVIGKEEIISLCAGSRHLLETNSNIHVYKFYETVQLAEVDFEKLTKEQQECRGEHIIPIPKIGYELYHESYGTSVTLGGSEKDAITLKNCKMQWGEWFNRSDSYEYGGRTYDNWEKYRNGFLCPIDQSKMAIAIIFVDDDLNNNSQLEPYRYLLLWSPSKKAWILPNRKYRYYLEKAYL